MKNTSDTRVTFEKTREAKRKAYWRSETEIKKRRRRRESGALGKLTYLSVNIFRCVFLRRFFDHFFSTRIACDLSFRVVLLSLIHYFQQKKKECSVCVRFYMRNRALIRDAISFFFSLFFSEKKTLFYKLNFSFCFNYNFFFFFCQTIMFLELFLNEGDIFRKKVLQLLSTFVQRWRFGFLEKILILFKRFT